MIAAFVALGTSTAVAIFAQDAIRQPATVDVNADRILDAPTPAWGAGDDPNPPWNGTEGRYPSTPHPIPGGFPSPANTGVPAGTTLRASGSLDITKDNTVIDGLDINGRVRIDADNVTIRNSRITASSRYALQIDGGRNILVEDTRVRAVGSETSSAVIVYGSGTTLRRVHITGGQDGLKSAGHLTLVDSLITGLYRAPGTHNDGIQIRSGKNYLIRNNTILGPYQASTSAMLVSTSAGPLDNLTIEENYLSGGSITLYVVEKGSRATNVRVRNNTFEGNSATVQSHTYDATGIVVEGNVVHTP